MATKNKIIEVYLELLQTDEEKLKNVTAFCKSQGWKDSEFFKHFNTLDEVESAFWTEAFIKTMGLLEKDDNFNEAGGREKMLFFFYTFIPQLEKQRSYVHSRFSRKDPRFATRVLSGVRHQFLHFAERTISDNHIGHSRYVPNFIQDQLHKPLWLSWLFVVDFWCKDKSKNFELTDAAIEKNINLAYDLIENGILDKTIDFGKFVFQQYRPV